MGRRAHHVRTLQPKTALHETDDLVKVPVSLIQGQQRRKLLGVNLLYTISHIIPTLTDLTLRTYNQVETTNLGQSEFFLIHTRRVDLFPDPF